MPVTHEKGSKVMLETLHPEGSRFCFEMGGLVGPSSVFPGRGDLRLREVPGLREPLGVHDAASALKWLTDLHTSRLQLAAERGL